MHAVVEHHHTSGLQVDLSRCAGPEPRADVLRFGEHFPYPLDGCRDGDLSLDSVCTRLGQPPAFGEYCASEYLHLRTPDESKDLRLESQSTREPAIKGHDGGVTRWDPLLASAGMPGTNKAVPIPDEPRSVCGQELKHGPHPGMASRPGYIEVPASQWRS